MRIPTLIFTATAALFVSAASVNVYANDNVPPVVTGGVAESGMDAIKENERDYKLKLVFAEPGGEYLSDVGVRIQNKRGETVVDTTSNGPVLLLNLAPGSYTVTSSFEGQTKAQKIQVGNSLKTYTIHLPAQS